MASMCSAALTRGSSIARFGIHSRRGSEPGAFDGRSFDDCRQSELGDCPQQRRHEPRVGKYHQHSSGAGAGVVLDSTFGTGSLAAAATLESCTFSFNVYGMKVDAAGGNNTAKIYLAQDECRTTPRVL